MSLRGHRISLNHNLVPRTFLGGLENLPTRVNLCAPAIDPHLGGLHTLREEQIEVLLATGCSDDEQANSLVIALEARYGAAIRNGSGQAIGARGVV